MEQSYSMDWRGTQDQREDKCRLLAATWISTEKSESASKEPGIAVTLSFNWTLWQALDVLKGVIPICLLV
jgi:hypothetical protein